FHEKLWQLIQGFPQLNPLTTAFGVTSLVLVLLPRWVSRLGRIPGPLLALVAATLVQGFFQFPEVATIGSAFGDIPRGLPSFAWPQWTLDRVISLIGPAFAIAMLGAIESLLS